MDEIEDMIQIKQTMPPQQIFAFKDEQVQQPAQSDHDEDDDIFERAEEEDLNKAKVNAAPQKEISGKTNNSENMRTEDGQEERINNHMTNSRMLQKPQQLEEPEDLFEFDV